MTLTATPLSLVRMTKVLVLHRVPFHAPSGTLTVVLGPKGAGKTSLLGVLLGAHSPHSGEVRLDDAPITPAQQLAMGFVPEGELVPASLRVARAIDAGPASADTQRRQASRISSSTARARSATSLSTISPPSNRLASFASVCASAARVDAAQPASPSGPAGSSAGTACGSADACVLTDRCRRPAGGSGSPRHRR